MIDSFHIGKLIQYESNWKKIQNSFVDHNPSPMITNSYESIFELNHIKCFSYSESSKQYYERSKTDISHFASIVLIENWTIHIDTSFIRKSLKSWVQILTAFILENNWGKYTLYFTRNWFSSFKIFTSMFQ
jgi:hypothetical protein